MDSQFNSSQTVNSNLNSSTTSKPKQNRATHRQSLSLPINQECNSHLDQPTMIIIATSSVKVTHNIPGHNSSSSSNPLHSANLHSRAKLADTLQEQDTQAQDLLQEAGSRTKI